MDGSGAVCDADGMRHRIEAPGLCRHGRGHACRHEVSTSLPPCRRVALAFGNEHDGISAELRGVADGAFAIPMRGLVESFNVSVAAAIALSTVTRRRSGDLGREQRIELKARWLMESVREPEWIVERFVRDHGQGG